MNNVNSLIEFDPAEFHSLTPDPDYDTLGAVEIITPEGQHISTINNQVPFCTSSRSTNTVKKMKRLTHATQFCKIFNRLFNLGISLPSAIDCDQIKYVDKIEQALNDRNIPNEKQQLTCNSFILFDHKNIGRCNNVVIFMPAYITTNQFDKLEGILDIYENFLVEVFITGYNPISSTYDYASWHKCSSLREAVEFLQREGRIQDYKLPLKELPIEYDVPLSRGQTLN